MHNFKSETQRVTLLVLLLKVLTRKKGRSPENKYMLIELSYNLTSF